MLDNLIYRLSPFITKWFAENYGRKLISKFLSEQLKAKTILDLGAGEGHDLQIARNLFPDAKLYAIESYPQYVQRLQKKGINVFSLDIEYERLPFEDATVDIIIINQVLEHTKNIFWILHECARVLRKGGAVVVGVPNIAAWHNRLMLLMGIQPPAIATLSCHIRGFTREDIKKTIEIGSGLTLSVRKSASAGFYPFPPYAARVLALIFPGLGWSIHLYAVKTKDYTDEFLLTARQFNETNFFIGQPSSK